MASGIALRFSLHRYELWNANSAGGLQQEACYRRECGNSHGELDHRTNAHATALITSVGNSILPVSITLLAAEQSSFLSL
jgi:hypothetical protein